MMHAKSLLGWVVLAGSVFVLSAGAAQSRSEKPLMWMDVDAKESDYYVAFRGQFELAREADVELHILGASWFVLWVDGQYRSEGPARFPVDYPEYDVVRVKLAAGRHVLAAQVHHIGRTTRMLPDMPPFFYGKAFVAGRELPVDWRCQKLPGYQSQVQQINPILPWIEWCDTRELPTGWRTLDFDDQAWAKPVAARTALGQLAPLPTASVQSFVHTLQPIAQGRLAETFGYEKDDISARFFLRDLVCDDLPPQGVWRRYDLGRVRLGRSRFVLDLPAGAVVEFAYSEALQQGRLSPWITLSTGPSCNLDHYIARGGAQEFFPLTPKGGRFVEVHILADPARVTFVEESYIERGYHGEPVGTFTCGDPLLDRIWRTGVETYRACAEDAVTDNPTRERGQWTGDVNTVGLDIAAVAYRDLRLFRRALLLAARCAREDGLVAGLCPGNRAYLPTFAAQWVGACVHYYELTGDKVFLEQVYPYAVRNLAAYDRFLTQDGLIDGAGWIFVDWGYQRNPEPANMAYNMQFLGALRAMVRWCRLLDREGDVARYVASAERIQAVVQSWLDKHMSDGSAGWQRVGYHSAVLALRLGLIEERFEADCVRFIKSHILDCFPNNPDAPRLSDPSVESRQLITPYFAHFALGPLIERGDMDFVLNQYRTCWGWALAGGRTTWVEVFDTRWTHCHHWSGAPTWQLSRYVLGLWARFDLGKNHFQLRLQAGSLPRAQGTLPLPGDGEAIHVEWERQQDGIHYVLQTEGPIWLHLLDPKTGKDQEVIEVTGRHERVLP